MEAMGGRIYVALEDVVGVSWMFEQRFIPIVEEHKVSALGGDRRRKLCRVGVCGEG